jgi:hypothetical protein
LLQGRTHLWALWKLLQGQTRVWTLWKYVSRIDTFMSTMKICY